MNHDILEGPAPRRVSRSWRFAAAIGTASLASGALLSAASAVGTPGATELVEQAQSATPSDDGAKDGAQPGRRVHVAGTVGSVNGSSFTVTRPDEPDVTVNTSSSTRYFKTVDATVADAAVGSYIGAHGTRASNGSLAANRVMVRPAPDREEGEPKSSGDGRHVRGEVTANDGTTLTVRTADGSQTVTTSSETRTFKTTPAGLSDVTTGSKVKAAGTAAGDRTLTAQRVHVNASSVTRPGPRPGPSRSRAEKHPGGRGDQRGRHANGTVASVNGSSFTVTRPDDSTVTVNTSSSTRYLKTVDATVVDAEVGSYIAAHGTRASNGSLAADRVMVRPEPANGDAEPKSSADGRHVRGRVTANDGTTLTIQTANGSQTVTTSSATKFLETSAAALSDVTTGSRVQVGGAPAEGGAIAARHVHINASSATRTEPGRPRGGRPGRGTGGRGGEGPPQQSSPQ